jgi:DNA-binding PadR family transcriptional regulator
MPETDPRRSIPLTLATFHILLTLAGGERHGYAIAKEVTEQTDGSVRLGPGTLYRILKQLTDDAWIDEIETAGEENDRRRTYRLTARGRAIAKAEAQRLAALVDLSRARRLLPAIT